MQGREANQRESDPEAGDHQLSSKLKVKDSHHPRETEHVDGRLHAEERIPSQGGNDENRANDVQIYLGLGVRPGKQTQLERGLSLNKLRPIRFATLLTALRSWPREMIMVYSGHPATDRPMKICNLVRCESNGFPSSYVSPPP